MPSSERDPRRPSLTRGWWTGLAVGALLLAAWCAVNVLVDPTGEFGQSGRHAFNRRLPPQVIAAGEAGNSPAFFTRAIRDHPGDTFLLGSSRTWRGFDTCSRPDVLRVAGSAWGVRDLTRVQRTILTSRRRPATLLIEVGFPTAERPAIRNQAEVAVATALSPRTTLLSLQTIRHSLAGGAAEPSGYAACTPLAAGAPDWEQAERSLRYSMGLFDTTSASLDEGRRSLMAMVEQADQLCLSTRVRHRLVLFNLPAMPAGSPAPEGAVRAHTARISERFAQRLPSRAGCEVRYVDLSTSPPGGAALWRDRRQWSDYTHFRPHLGALALAALDREAR